MKKILLSKTFILTVVILINFILIFIAFIPNFVSETTGQSSLPDFEPNTLQEEIVVPCAKKEYKIQYGTLYDFYYAKAYLEADSETSYVVYECVILNKGIEYGSYVKKNDVIGYDFSQNEVVIETEGTVVNIVNYSDYYRVEVYCPIKYTVSCLINQVDYYKLVDSLSKVETYLDISGIMCELSYIGPDYIGGFQNGQIALYYTFYDENHILMNNTSCYIAIKTFEYKDVFYIEKSAFSTYDDPIGINKPFLYNDDNEIKYVSVKALYECGDYYIVHGPDLEEGMILYDEYK